MTFPWQGMLITSARQAQGSVVYKVSLWSGIKLSRDVERVRWR